MSQKLYKKKKVWLDITKFSFSQPIINQWNSLPENVVSAVISAVTKSVQIKIKQLLEIHANKVPARLLYIIFATPASVGEKNTRMDLKHLTAILTTRK